MIQYGDLNRNLDTDDILLLLAKRDAEYFMDAPSTFHMRESYVLKSQGHDHNTQTYMDALSGENDDEYYRAIDDKIKSLMVRDTW